MKIKNKKQLFDYLDNLINEDNIFKMPRFSKVGKKSNFFNSRYKKLIKIINKNKQSYFDKILIDEILLTTYFSSSEIIHKINKLNKKMYKSISNTPIKNIFHKKKNFFRNINL